MLTTSDNIGSFTPLGFTTEQVVALTFGLVFIIGAVYLAGTLVTAAVMLLVGRWRGQTGARPGWVALFLGPTLTSLILGVVAANFALDVGRMTMRQFPGFGDIDGLLSRMPDGSASVIAPPAARQYEPFEVRLAVTSAELEAAVAASFESRKGSPAEQAWTRIPLAKRMRAEVSGIDFKFDDPTAVEQLVTSRQTTQWVWRAQGVWPGERSFQVRLYAVFEEEGQQSQRLVYSRPVTVNVDLNLYEAAVRHWEWVATHLLLPGVGVLFGFLLGTRKSQVPPSP